MMQKSISPECKDEAAVALLYIQAVQGTHRTGCLTLRRAKGTEIMFPDEALGRLTHALQFERSKRPTGTSMSKGRSYASLSKYVHIRTRKSRKARVEVVVDLPGPLDSDAIGQKRVKTPDPRLGRPLSLGVDVDDLAKRVNSSVGTAGTDSRRSVGKKLCQRRFQGILNSEPAGLGLPPLPGLTIVCQAQRHTRHT